MDFGVRQVRPNHMAFVRVRIGLVGAWNHLVLPNAMMFDGMNVARSLVSDSTCRLVAPRLVAPY
jgi:hypothetical protein